MGCLTGFARFILIGFNVFLGLIAIACIVLASYALAENKWMNHGFLIGFLIVSILFFLYTTFGCRAAKITEGNKHRCSSFIYLTLSIIFLVGFFAIAVILSVYLSHLNKIYDTSENEFSVIRKSAQWDNSDTTSIYDDVHSSFDTTYDDGKCSGGGVSSLTSDRKGKTVITWRKFECEESSYYDAIDNFLRTPANGEESNNFLTCFSSISKKVPTIDVLRADQRLGTWCRSNKALFGVLESYVIGGAVASWVLAGTLLLAIISVIYLKCRS